MLPRKNHVEESAREREKDRRRLKTLFSCDTRKDSQFLSLCLYPLGMGPRIRNLFPSLVDNSNLIVFFWTKEDPPLVLDHSPDKLKRIYDKANLTVLN